MTNEVLKELGELLATEREALLSGNIADVERLADRKKELAEYVSFAAEADHKILRELRELARRNHALLEASQKGLASAKARLGEIRRAVTHLDTYTQDGGKLDLMTQASSVEKRA